MTWLNRAGIYGCFLMVLGGFAHAQDQDIWRQIVESQLGTPYRWGRVAPGKGFDCSGFVFWVYREAKNRYLVDEGFRRGTAQSYFNRIGEHVLDRRPGDLVFFRSAPGMKITHVGIYLGDGMFGHCSIGQGVNIARLSDFADIYLGAKRILEESAPSSDPQIALGSWIFQVWGEDLVAHQPVRLSRRITNRGTPARSAEMVFTFYDEDFNVPPQPEGHTVVRYASLDPPDSLPVTVVRVPLDVGADGWLEDERVGCSVRVMPLRQGTVSFQYRITLQRGDAGAFSQNWPQLHSGNTFDITGFPAQTEEIQVR